MKRTFALVVGLTLSFFAISSIAVNTAHAAGKKMKITKFTGQIQIKLADGSIIGVVAGAALPEIPAGAEIVVVSGEATFSVGGTVVTASAGDSFSYSQGSDGAAAIAATGSKSNIEVAVGGTKATLKSGDAVSVSASPSGTGALKVTAGEVSVNDGKTTTTLTKASKPVPVKAAATTPTTTTPAPTTKTKVVVEKDAVVADVLDALGLDAADVVVEVQNENQNTVVNEDLSPSSP